MSVFMAAANVLAALDPLDLLAALLVVLFVVPIATAIAIDITDVACGKFDAEDDEADLDEAGFMDLPRWANDDD